MKTQYFPINFSLFLCSIFMQRAICEISRAQNYSIGE